MPFNPFDTWKETADMARQRIEYDMDEDEHIARFEDLTYGDVLVARSGNRYDVKAADGATVVVSAPDGGCPPFDFDPADFAFGLTRAMPYRPGLWRDREGDLWAVDGRGAHVLTVDGVWALCDPSDVDEVCEYAPFTPVRVED